MACYLSWVPYVQLLLHQAGASPMPQILSQSSSLCPEVPSILSCLAIGNSDLYQANQKVLRQVRKDRDTSLHKVQKDYPNTSAEIIDMHHHSRCMWGWR